MDAVASIGTANDLYYEDLGIPESRRHLAPYTVDNAFFREHRLAKALARERLGLEPEGPVMLYVGKLAPRKDPGTLVAAAALYDHSSHVLVAGDGSLRDELRRQAARLGVALTVLGFMNQTEIPLAYCAADMLVLPSLVEPWGLVVNEAMCAELPVVVSSRVGARLDLVIPGLNGAVFRAGDARSLARVIAPIVESAELRERYGSASAARIDAWDLEHTVEGIVDAVVADD
jgi:glycosyltransferase involved in cell wall biosynthesis